MNPQTEETAPHENETAFTRRLISIQHHLVAAASAESQTARRLLSQHLDEGLEFDDMEDVRQGQERASRYVSAAHYIGEAIAALCRRSTMRGGPS